jgi:hypothetical protein
MPGAAMRSYAAPARELSAVVCFRRAGGRLAGCRRPNGQRVFHLDDALMRRPGWRTSTASKSPHFRSEKLNRGNAMQFAR